MQFQMNERLTADEYLEYLCRTDLGSQYPRENFLQRIDILMENYDVSATARDDDGRLVGVGLGITDFAYFLFVTDLSVDRALVGQGIGKELLRMLHEAAGGEDDIIMYTDSASNAIGFYEKSGMKNYPSLMAKDCKAWTEFTVTEDELEKLRGESDKT
ncbi:MAG: GNAT family N-acetyltransferase [Anaerolineaceae bacterium]|nr:GNAT family N-acetyltransferase [Anaerolineaceae bacterium]